jgi:hypothetical protein
MRLPTQSTPQRLGEFLAVLEQRLAALPVEDLRAALVAHAERLPASNREAFLARDRQRLLTEAAGWHAGIDGLATVARRPGEHQPTAYLDWIDALTGDGRIADAAAASSPLLPALPARRR